MSFSEYVERRDAAVLSEGWRDYLPFRASGGFDPGRRRFLRTAAAAGAAAGLSAYAPRGERVRYEPHPANVDELIRLVQSRFSRELGRSGVEITRKNVQFVKPREVLEPAWGGAFGSVVSRAGEEQGRDPESGLDQSVTQVGGLDVPVMVVFVDPAKFGQDANGFHSSVYTGGGQQHFVVVRPDFNPSTLRHEMRHAMQNTLPYVASDKMLDGGDDDFVAGYLSQTPELGVRFAELRMRYYRLTGKLVEDDEGDVRAMLLHLTRNKDQYPADVRQLLIVLSEMIRRGKVGAFLDYMRRNMAKYVRGDPSRVLGASGGGYA